MTTWYKTSPHLLSISEFEVTRYTKNHVWIRVPSFFKGDPDSERKEKISSHHAQYHQNFHDACMTIKSQAEEQASSARELLIEANRVLEMIESGKIRYHKAPSPSNMDKNTIQI